MITRERVGKPSRKNSPSMVRRAVKWHLENCFRNNFIKFADINFLSQVQFKLASFRPKLQFGVQIKRAGIFRRVHDDRFERNRVDFDFLASQSLFVGNDNALVRHDCCVAHRLISDLRYFPWNQQFVDRRRHIDFLRKRNC